MLELAQIAALLTVAVVCVAVCLLIVQVRHTLLDANAQLHIITQKATGDLDQVQLDLEEGHRLELEAALTAMEARKASAEERAALPKLTAQASHAIASLDAWMVAARNTTSSLGEDSYAVTESTTDTLQSVNEAVRSMQPAIEQARSSIAELQTVEADLDRQVNDPAIASSLHNIDGTTASMEASAKDVQQEVHAITHPGWLHRCWGWALDVAHVFNPLMLFIATRW